MNKRNLWIFILILVVAFLIVAAFFWVRRSAESPDAGKEQEDKGSSVTEYTVKFYSNDGTILKIDPVEEGNAATPPSQPQLLYGTVFQAWDQDISRIISDLEVHPICEDITGKENVFAIDGAYGKSGGTVIVPIRLCGDVCVSAFDLTINYNADALELVSVTEDGAVMYNDEVPGQIRLNYVSTENTVADVDICYLQFSVNTQLEELPVALELHSIYACEASLESNNDGLYVPAYSVVNGAVYVLPEGG